MSIISFKNKFVFVKTKKVAGTSVEALLRKYTGDDDIVPAVTPRDEHYSAAQGDFSKNYLKVKENESVYTEFVMAGEYDKAVDFLSNQKKIAYSHMDYDYAESLIVRYGYKPSDFYFFTIDRHPYFWLLSSVLYNNSQYNSTGKVDLNIDVEKINASINRLLHQHDLSQKINWSKYTKNNKVMVNKVVDYDYLELGLKEVFQVLGFSERKLTLPDLKKCSRHLDAFQLLSILNKAEAQKAFAYVFKYMDYKY